MVKEKIDEMIMPGFFSRMIKVVVFLSSYKSPEQIYDGSLCVG
jgi:hypothetical protein